MSRRSAGYPKASLVTDGVALFILQYLQPKMHAILPRRRAPNLASRASGEECVESRSRIHRPY